MTYGDYPDLNGVKKILVVKLRQLGDVLLSGAVFGALRAKWPEARIDAYVYSEAFALLEGHPGVDGLVGYDRGWKRLGVVERLRREWALWRRLRGEGYDVVINLTEGDRGALAAWMSGARVRVGFETKGWLGKRVYTHRVKHCPGLRHTVERNLDALRRIGIFPGVEERELFLSVPESARVAVRRWVEGPFVVIHPTSRWRFKCWEVGKMRQLTEELIRRGKRVVFTSGPDAVERAMVREISEGLDVVNLGGKISLKELAALIEMCELLVCVDSVPFHMASALKKRVVAIFGPTSDVTWGPWRNEGARVVAQNFSCRPCYQDGCGGSKMSDCLATLPVGAVLRAIDGFRGESLRQGRCGALEGR
ncbi:MAG TPA: putative lipopolysaccharide heptosyltransferase III [Chlamydiales bacterium]|nr:putative lipopolysaccharide heptosyltransferase III [Chlamydiales bacterium]